MNNDCLLYSNKSSPGSLSLLFGGLIARIIVLAPTTVHRILINILLVLTFVLLAKQ